MEKNISDEEDALLEGLMHLGIPGLQQKHREIFGKDCTVLHVLYLRRKLAWEIQARATAVCLRSRVSMLSASPGKPLFEPGHIPS
jgi:hypothetical protein